MPNPTFYVLSNEATGADNEYASLDAALDAVDLTVGERDHWEIHEFLSKSIARWVTDGRGRTTTFQEIASS